jgi:hypothetical protein
MLAVILRLFLLTTLLPALVSGILYLVLRNILSRFALVIAVVLGCLSSYLAVRGGFPNFPPKEFRDYIFYLAVVGLLWSVLEPLWSNNRVVRWAGRTVLLLGSLFLVFQNRIRSWETLESVLWFAGIVLFLLVFWWTLERLTGFDTKPNESLPLPARELYIALVILIAGTSITLATSGSASLGQTSGALAASIGAVMVLSWFMNVPVPTSLAAVLVFTLGVLWFGGSVFAKVPVWSSILLALSPLLLLFIKTPKTLRGSATRLAVFAIPVILVTAYAAWRFAVTYNQPSF